MKNWCDPLWRKAPGGASATASPWRPHRVPRRGGAGRFLSPWMTVIASKSRRTVERVEALFRPFGGEMRTYNDPAIAEMIKCTHNVFNATKISFWNEVWLICDRLGLPAEDVASVVARSAEGSTNIEYGIRGGAPYGGACLPKDVAGFLGLGGPTRPPPAHDRSGGKRQPCHGRAPSHRCRRSNAGARRGASDHLRTLRRRCRHSFCTSRSGSSASPGGAPGWSTGSRPRSTGHSAPTTGAACRRHSGVPRRPRPLSHRDAVVDAKWGRRDHRRGRRHRRDLRGHRPQLRRRGSHDRCSRQAGRPAQRLGSRHHSASSAGGLRHHLG